MAIQPMALEVQNVQGNALGAFAQGQQQAQQQKMGQMEIARANLQDIAQMAHDAGSDPQKWEMGLDILERAGLPVQNYRGRADLAPMVQKFAMSAADEVQFAQNERELNLSMQRFQHELQQAAKGPPLTAVQQNLAAAGLQEGTDEYRQAVLSSMGLGAKDREIRTGPDGIERYVDNGEPVFPGVSPAPAVPDFGDTSKLRTEIQALPSYKNLAQAAPIYQAMSETAGRDTRASDLNLVYGLGKIMDPTSVVREGEMFMVQGINTLPDKVIEGVNSLLTGSSTLSPETRRAILTEAYGRMKGYQDQFSSDVGQYEGIVERNKLNRADVIPSFGQIEPWAPASASPPAITTQQEYDALPSGAQYKDPTGQIRTKS